MNKVIQGDCLEKLKDLEDNSVDSIVTDPPYELGFMGKKWDNTGIAYNIELWKECLRVLKPGGHLLSFGGTRTYHRMACAIEDAGFEIRDCIMWVYGSGFPKSLNIGKAVDKLQGNEREVIGRNPNSRENCDKTNTLYKSGTVGKTDYLTKGNSPYEGWGTALKPAHEPICMARKPLAEKTVAENCLKWGTGGINIDESRVGTTGARNNGNSQGTIGSNSIGVYGKAIKQDYNMGRFPANLIHDNSEEVRECFPETKGDSPNRKERKGGHRDIFVGTENNNVRNQIISDVKFTDSGNASRYFKSIPHSGEDFKSLIYQAKASKSERNRGCEGLENEKFTAGNYSQSPVCKTCDKTLNGTNDHSKCSGEVYYREMESKNTKNNHPTVKPIALMEYLIKMITPKGGIVLDPFAGSGSTLIAAKQEGFNFIGIEKEKEYIEIAEARLKATPTPML